MVLLFTSNQKLYMKSIYFFVFFFLSLSLYSQKNFKATEEDFQLVKEISNNYDDEDIAIINSSEDVFFGYNTSTKKVTVKRVVKKDFINLKSYSRLPIFLFYDNESEIAKAEIRYPNNRIYTSNFKDDYYESQELFHTDARVRQTSLTFPTKAYKFSLNYTKKYRDIKYFTQSFFDDIKPTIDKKITLHIPGWLDLEIKQFNINSDSITKTITKEKEVQVVSFEMKNLKGAFNEKHTLGPSHYRPHLLFLAKSHSKNGKEIKLINNLNNLYGWYHGLVSSISENNIVLQDKVASIIKNCATDSEKIKAIYYWVQDNIRYIAFEDGIAGFKPESAANVFKKKYGDCKGMANLTKQMLIIAGFDSRLTWIGTKRIPYDYTTPSIAVDNHMICSVYHNDKAYFLDATEKYNSINFYAERIQGKQMLIENGEDYILETVPTSDLSKNLSQINEELQIEEETLIGKAERIYKGESKKNILNEINAIKIDRRDKVIDYYLKNGDKNITVTDVSSSDINNRDIDLKLNYKIKKENIVSSFGDEVYIDLNYYKFYNNLDLSKREHTYAFQYKQNKEINIKLKLNSGYKVKQLPEEIIIDNIDFKISIKYETAPGYIIYKATYKFPTGQISKEELVNWRQAFEKLKRNYENQLILTKK